MSCLWFSLSFLVLVSIYEKSLIDIYIPRNACWYPVIAFKSTHHYFGEVNVNIVKKGIPLHVSTFHIILETRTTSQFPQIIPDDFEVSPTSFSAEFIFTRFRRRWTGGSKCFRNHVYVFERSIEICFYLQFILKSVDCFFIVQRLLSRVKHWIPPPPTQVFLLRNVPICLYPWIKVLRFGFREIYFPLRDGHIKYFDGGL